MNENLKKMMETVNGDKELAGKFNGRVDELMKNDGLTKAEAMAKAGRELGFEVTCAQIERLIADMQELDMDDLEQAAGGDDTPDGIAPAKDARTEYCDFNYSCYVIVKHPDLGEKNEACLKDYYCGLIYHEDPDATVC